VLCCYRAGRRTHESPWYVGLKSFAVHVNLVLNLSIDVSAWKFLSQEPDELVPHRSYLRSLPLGQLPTTGYHPHYTNPLLDQQAQYLATTSTYGVQRF